MKSLPRTKTLLAVATALGMGATLAGFSPHAMAGPYVFGPTIGANPTLAIPDIPDVHPGKEYSDETDKNATPPGVPDDMATIRFDGAPPGGVADGFDYDGADTAGSERQQVDAMANVRDALFFQVRDDLTAMAVSFRNGLVLDSTLPAPASYFGRGVQGSGVDVGTDDPIYFETTGGLLGTWAMDKDVDQHGVENLDGLEIWGPDAFPDANRYSLYGDGISGVSIYNETPGLPDSTYLSHPMLAAALFASGLPEFTLPPTVDFDRQLIDIDALMVQDRGGLSTAFDSASDWIMFSLWGISPGGGGSVPVPPGGLVGDAIYVWNFGSPITHLVHGGHPWFDSWTCGTVTGSPNECLQVDAMEALAVDGPLGDPNGNGVPEPGTLGLLGMGLIGTLLAVRRRRAV